jgi:cardiolipin synthase A/B
MESTDANGSQTSFSQGNRATLFDEGEALFRDLQAAIRSARERVWIETFLFTPDETGRATLELAADAAHRGCDVILLFDQVGTHVTNLGFFKPVEDAGGRVGIFNPLPPWRRYGRRIGSFLRHRDHRKNMVVDDAGYCGGHNFSSAYMGPPPHHFYDMTVKVEGPCVRDLAALFLDSFEKTTGESRPLPPAPEPLGGGVPARAVGLDAEHGHEELVRTYGEILDAARREAVLLFGYFAPDEPLRAPLLAAADRGVKVSILTAGKIDFPPLRLAGQHTYDPLLAAGIRIFQLQEPVLHAKTMAVDGEVCLAGSFDVNRLERRNTAEVAVHVIDPRLAGRIEEGFRSASARAREITLADREGRSFVGRALERVSYHLMGV